jgi:hypothetical protein
LLHLIWLGLRSSLLDVDLGGNAALSKGVMAATYMLHKAEVFERAAQVIEPDGCIGCPAQNAPKYLVRGHDNILAIDSNISAKCRTL